KGPDIVTPPTPAAVERILVQTGQAVEEGQSLIVVSAMKMEMTLAAPYAGVVANVNTMEGAQVAPGDILVEITANESTTSQDTAKNDVEKN
ncbi:MAG: biotin/lipoyl-binding protein, partial [Xanthomonadaceae bacterium]|nr:biotin/lipoyl-binding protein [Xanthomonadaceae bacterium]